MTPAQAYEALAQGSLTPRQACLALLGSACWWCGQSQPATLLICSTALHAEPQPRAWSWERKINAKLHSIAQQRGEWILLCANCEALRSEGRQKPIMLWSTPYNSRDALQCKFGWLQVMCDVGLTVLVRPQCGRVFDWSSGQRMAESWQEFATYNGYTAEVKFEVPVQQVWPAKLVSGE